MYENCGEYAVISRSVLRGILRLFIGFGFQKLKNGTHPDTRLLNLNFDEVGVE
jgi:hypothetical protein